MKVKIYSLCLFLLLFWSALAPVIRSQTAPTNAPDYLPEPFQFVRDNLKLNDYLTALLNLRANQEKYLASKMKISFLEWIIQMENSVRDYEESYRYEDILYAKFPAMKSIVEQYRKDFADIKSSPIADYQMPDAIRTALKLGYKIVPYETRDRICRSTENNPKFCTDKRERAQSRNVFLSINFISFHVGAV
jgi:hypothetical protein